MIDDLLMVYQVDKAHSRCGWNKSFICDSDQLNYYLSTLYLDAFML